MTVQTRSVATFLDWAFGELAKSSGKHQELESLAARVLSTALSKGTSAQKERATSFAISFRCYDLLARATYREQLHLTTAQLKELTAQVRAAHLRNLSTEEIGDLISIAEGAKALKFGSLLAEKAVERGELQRVARLAESLPGIVTKRLMMAVEQWIRANTNNIHYNHPCLTIARSYLHLLPEPRRSHCVAFLCGRGVRFCKDSDVRNLEAQFTYFMQFDPWKMLDVAAPKNRRLLQKGLDEAVIRFGLTDGVKKFARQHRLSISSKVLQKAIAVHAQRVRLATEEAKALRVLSLLLARVPEAQRPVCMTLYKEKRWELLGELLKARLDVEGEVRLKTAEALVAKQKFGLAAKVMAVDRSATRRKQFVAGLTTLSALRAAEQCGLPVTRDKINELFSRGELKFISQIRDDWNSERLWVDSVAWAAIKLGSKAAHRRGLSALEPLLSKSHWARLWSLHFASQLQQQRTTKKLLSLLAREEQNSDESFCDQILEVLGSEPFGISVLGA